jgi:4-diphosphocytidyl-2-C-methyl-D-erythritol kinase
VYVRQGSVGCEVLAPAKLNLFLEVLARRPDGFHEIETLMVPIDLFDSLSVRNDPGGTVRLTCDWAAGLRKAKPPCGSARPDDAAAPDDSGRPPVAEWEKLPEGSDNIAVRAVELLRRRAGVQSGAVLQLTKRIPSAAGLGGGSSDAAAALVAVNRVWNLSWSRRQLQEVAAEVGSDVPFFLESGAAVCRGRGERIERLSGIRALDFVVVAPPAGLSTVEVYRGCRPAESPRRLERLTEALKGGDLRRVALEVHNRLEPTAERLSPWIARTKFELAECGCIAVRMSGSGSSCFGICRDARQARHAARWMRARGWSRSAAVRSTR